MMCQASDTITVEIWLADAKARDSSDALNRGHAAGNGGASNTRACDLLSVCYWLCLRQVDGGTPNSRLNARLKAASDS